MKKTGNDNLYIHLLTKSGGIILGFISFLTLDLSGAINKLINIMRLTDTGPIVDLMDWLMKLLIALIITLSYTLGLCMFRLKRASQEDANDKFKIGGIDNVYFGRHDLQSNGFAVDDLLNSVGSNSKICVFSRSARAYGEQYELVQKVMQLKNIEFTFVLSNPELSTFDNRGKNDLLHTLSLFEAGIHDKSKLKVYLVDFYTTYSFVLIESNDCRRAVLDVFIDLPYENRHTVTLSDKDSEGHFIQSLAETKDRYLSIAKRVDFEKTKFNEETHALVFIKQERQ